MNSKVSEERKKEKKEKEKEKQDIRRLGTNNLFSALRELSRRVPEEPAGRFKKIPFSQRKVLETDRVVVALDRRRESLPCAATGEVV